MAAEKDLELEDDESNGGGKSKTKLIIILVVVLLIVGIGAGAAFFLLSGDDSEGPVQSAEQQSDTLDSESAKQENSGLPKKAYYVGLNPAFVISFQMGSRARFLQFRLEILTYKKSVSSALEDNMPMIRNEVVMLVGRQDLAKLRTKEGREELQQTLKDTLNQALDRDAGEQGIEAVLFTDYVMQ